jgi:hypothetical protein
MGISFKDLLDKLNILHYLNVPWMVLYLIYYFGADRKSPGPKMQSDWLKLFFLFAVRRGMEQI